jgi:FkbM family methyltransferase
MLKKFIKSITVTLTLKLGATRIGRVIMETLLNQAMDRSIKVFHKDIELIFSTPNPLTAWRAATFSEKEPETLEWIDNMETGSILWDIGANVGLYSIYAAKSVNATVFSFEPSIFNLELLGRNICNNKVDKNISIVPIALSNTNGFNFMRHTTMGWGGALSGFGTEINQDGNKLNSIYQYKTLGFKPDDLLKTDILIQPDHIKLDVDGIEHLILAGSQKILKHTKSILVEINEDFSTQNELARKILLDAGFQQTITRQSVYNLKDQNISNQIWVR